MRDREELFLALARSKFRSRFRLTARERDYLYDRGMPVILQHGREFITSRLAPAEPKNDGKQTPMRGHPIFIAQHATATCCRSCLSKWHRLPAGRALSADEVDYVLDVLQGWLTRQSNNRDRPTLFDEL